VLAAAVLAAAVLASTGVLSRWLAPAGGGASLMRWLLAGVIDGTARAGQQMQSYLAGSRWKVFVLNEQRDGVSGP
jgi:hypothetical protein